MIDIVVVVVLEITIVDRDARVRAQHSQVLATVVLHDQRTPGLSISRSLVAKASSYGCQAISAHAGHVLCVVVGIRERERDGNVAHKVNIAFTKLVSGESDGLLVNIPDVHEDLESIVGEFAKAEVDVVIGIRRVENRWLYETWPGIHGEHKLLAL